MDDEWNHGVTFTRGERGYAKLATMDKDFTFTLITGYDAKARFHIIRRFQDWTMTSVRKSLILPPYIAMMVMESMTY